MGGISVELLKDYFGANSGGIHPNIRRETHGRISGQNPRIISEEFLESSLEEPLNVFLDKHLGDM